MKRFIIFTFLIFVGVVCFSQKPYDENIDAIKQIKSAVQKAKMEDKYVLCQVGGNWCPWCLKFAEFADTNKVVKSIIDKHYVYIHVNYSKQNKNIQAMHLLENPARFGFPVFVILDENGKRIHTQNSAYLEDGKSYSENKVSEFLSSWTKESINTYK